MSDSVKLPRSWALVPMAAVAEINPRSLCLYTNAVGGWCRIGRDDFDRAELTDKGERQRAWGLFGKDLDTLMNEMNEELVA